MISRCRGMLFKAKKYIKLHNEDPPIKKDCSSHISLRISEFLELRPATIATQLTLLDINCFKKIQFKELQSCAWIKSNLNNPSLNVVDFIKRFNDIMFWAMDTILLGATAELRCSVIEHLLQTAAHLMRLRNFHSTCAITFALESLPVQRLHSTWELLSPKKLKKFQKLQLLCSAKNNYEKLRKHMHKQMFYNSRCIPYIVPFLRDLLKIDLDQPGPDICNLKRVTMMMEPIKTIQNYQKSNYDDLSNFPFVQKYLLSLEYNANQQKQMQDQSYKTSLQLEPLEEQYDSMSLSQSSIHNEKDWTSTFGKEEDYSSQEDDCYSCQEEGYSSQVDLLREKKHGKIFQATRTHRKIGLTTGRLI